MKGCDIRIFGFKIASVCGLVERKIKEHGQKFINRWTEFEAPKLMDKLEAAIKKAEGQKIAFPITAA